MAQVALTDASNLVELTQQALAKRTVATTRIDSSCAASCGSTCLVTLTVQRHLPDGSVMHGKLTLADLAGKTLQLC